MNPRNGVDEEFHMIGRFFFELAQAYGAGPEFGTFSRLADEVGTLAHLDMSPRHTANFLAKISAARGALHYQIEHRARRIT